MTILDHYGKEKQRFLENCTQCGLCAEGCHIYQAKAGCPGSIAALALGLDRTASVTTKQAARRSIEKDAMAVVCDLIIRVGKTILGQTLIDTMQ